MSKLDSAFVPNHVYEALLDPKWKSTIVEEMKALKKNVTWELIELPRGKRTVGV